MDPLAVWPSTTTAPQSSCDQKEKSQSRWALDLWRRRTWACWSIFCGGRYQMLVRSPEWPCLFVGSCRRILWGCRMWGAAGSRNYVPSGSHTVGLWVGYSPPSGSGHGYTQYARAVYSRQLLGRLGGSSWGCACLHSCRLVWQVHGAALQVQFPLPAPCYRDRAVRGGASTGANSFNTRSGILSGRHALLGFSLLSSFWTPVTSTCMGVMVNGVLGPSDGMWLVSSWVKADLNSFPSREACWTASVIRAALSRNGGMPIESTRRDFTNLQNGLVLSGVSSPITLSLIY